MPHSELEAKEAGDKKQWMLFENISEMTFKPLLLVRCIQWLHLAS